MMYLPNSAIAQARADYIASAKSRADAEHDRIMRETERWMPYTRDCYPGDKAQADKAWERIMDEAHATVDAWILEQSPD